MKSFIIDTQDLWNDFVSFVKESKDAFDIVSFDLETNSVEEIKAQVWGIGLAFQDSEAFYLPLRDKEGNSILDENEVVPFVSNLLAGKKIIGHNLVYDVTVWKHRYGIDLVGSVHADTILMKHTLNEEPPFALKDIAVHELGAWADKAQQELYASIEANGGSTTKTNLQMFKADTEVLGTYCCFTPGSSKITMEDGTILSAENITEGQKVLTHTGKFKSVLSSFSKIYSGDIFSFEVEHGRKQVGVTAEHPYLVLDQKNNKTIWKRADEILVGDLLVKGSIHINNQPSLSKTEQDFSWLVGFYLAEGHLSQRGSKKVVVFSTHRDEVAKLKEQLKDEKVARELLRKKGFYVETLWSVDDVTANYVCSQEQAHRVLELALKNEATMEQVWWAIDDAAESLEIKSNQN